jgi:hypothetical protein
MDGLASLILSIVILAVLWYMLTRLTRSDLRPPPRSMVDDIEDDIKRERKVHAEALSKALSDCQNAHHDAVNALSWLAVADGTVSKQELRGIFRFCEEQGTPIDKEVYKAIDSLNAGMSMQVKSSETDAHRSIAALTSMDAAYRLAFYGAANKLCGSQKQLSQAKQRFLKQAEAIVG